MSKIPANDIYEVIDIVGRDWPRFAKTKLCLTEVEIEDCEYQRSLIEGRFQMVQKWIRNEGCRATTDKLYEMTRKQPPSAEPQQSRERYVEDSTANNLQRLSVTSPQDDISTGKLGKSQNGSPIGGLQRNKDIDKGEAGSTSKDLPVKAFMNEKSTEKGHKRSESGGSQCTSSSLENFSSSESMTKSKKKSGSGTLKKIFRKLKPTKPKAFSNEGDSGLCDAVHNGKVKPMTKEYETRIVGKAQHYPTHKSPGCVLILNNSFLNDKSKRRHGAEKDVSNMEELWSQIGCDIYGDAAHQEKTAEEMIGLLKKMRTLKKVYSYIVVVVMTHGDLVNGHVIFKGVDNKDVKVADVEMLFSNANAPKLKEIPKLFIFQFCCGDKVDSGVQLDHPKMSPSKPTTVGSGNVRTDGGNKVPTSSDIHFEYPTHREHAAIRDPENGSWFITAITNIFMEYACCEDVHDMLLRVRGVMKRKFGLYEEVVDGKTKRYEINAMSWGNCGCDKKLYLLPGFKYPKK